MRIGLIGSGNMARAMARGWGEPVLCSDSGSGRAAQLVAEVGGEALPSAEVAARADVVFLCHKPYQLDEVAAEIAGRAEVVASVLGSSTLAELKSAYPGTPVVRLIPNTPVEVRRGIVVHAEDPDADPAAERTVLELCARLGTVVTVAEERVEAATSVAGVGPAYLALIAEAWVDSAVKLGLKAPDAASLVAETMAGTAQLLAARGGDSLAVRREVTSPGGSTARGLAALEAGGVRAAMLAAGEAVAGR